MSALTKMRPRRGASIALAREARRRSASLSLLRVRGATGRNTASPTLPKLSAIVYLLLRLFLRTKDFPFALMSTVDPAR